MAARKWRLVLLCVVFLFIFFVIFPGDEDDPRRDVSDSEHQLCNTFCVYDRRTGLLALNLVNFMHNYLDHDRVHITYKLQHFDELTASDIEEFRAFFDSFLLDNATLLIVNLADSFAKRFPKSFWAEHNIPPHYYRGYLCKPLGILLSTCETEVVMDNDVIPLMHPFILLQSEQYLSTGIIMFNHVDMEYCLKGMGTCNEDIIVTYPKHALRLIDTFARDKAASRAIINKTQFFHLLSHGHDSSIMAIDRVKAMPKISRKLQTLLTDFEARSILFGNASTDLGLFKFPGTTYGDCEIFPLSFILSGHEYGRSNWLSLWINGEDKCSGEIVMYQFNPLNTQSPELFYLQGPYIEQFRGKADGFCLNEWLNPDSRFAEITSYVTRVSHTRIDDRRKFPFTVKYNHKDKQIINLYYKFVWNYPKYF